jgi:2-dehydro-3-deoxygluconokinase
MVNAANIRISTFEDNDTMRQSHGEIIAIGECMVELARGDDGRFSLNYGGDTFNTSVYLARAGQHVRYATLLGDDPFSNGIRTIAAEEGIDASLAGTIAGRMPGLYLIETTSKGERSFYYWRDRAPARELFTQPHGRIVSETMMTARSIYFSGITLSLYDAAGLDAFAAALHAARANGATIVMDGNFRPRGWPDIGHARTIFARFWSLSDIALPTFDDEQALWSDTAPTATVERLAALGVAEIAVKCGPEGALSHAHAHSTHVPCPAAINPIDTTAAGDSFNAAYLAARNTGASPADAVLSGHKLAAIVIQHRGAIVPKSATASVLRAITR